MSFEVRDRVGDHILVVSGKNGGRFPRSYAVVVLDETVGLIDAGCDPEALAAIDEQFAPEIVIYSHAHPDHCSGAARFRGRLHGPIESRAWAGNLQRIADRHVGPGPRADWLEYMIEVVGFEDFDTEGFFRDGDVFDFGHTKMQAVGAPGHTDDHTCFYFPAQQLMLTTDIDLTAFGPWYGNSESDIGRFERSIEKVRAYPIAGLISSHKGLIRDHIDQRLDAFVGAIATREQLILEFLTQPRSLDDFIDAALIYRRYPYRASILRYWEGEMVAKHLQRLRRAGKVIHGTDGLFAAV